jgi:hypothetical protein
MTTKPTRRRPKPEPVPLAARVKKARALLVKRGGAKIPGGFFQPDAAEALDYLHRHKYDPTRVGCLARALIETAARERKRAARTKPRKP